MFSIIWPLLVASVLIHPKAQESGPRSVAALLPEDTICFCSVGDLNAFRAAVRETSIGRIAAEEEVEECLRQPLAALAQWWNQKVGVPLDGLLDGECRRIFVAVIRLDESTTTGGEFGLIVGWEGETVPAGLASTLFHRMTLGGMFVFSPSEDALAVLRAVEQGSSASLAGSPSFQASLEALAAGPSELFLYVEAALLQRALSDLEVLDDLRPFLSRPCPARSLAARWVPREGRSHTSVFLSEDPASDWLRRLCPAVPFSAEDLRVIPEDALLAQFFNLELRALPELLADGGWSDPADLTQQTRKLCGQLAERLGPRCLVANPSSRFISATEYLFSIEVRDEGQLIETLTALIEQASRAAPVPFSLRQVEVEGSQVFQLVSREGGQTNIAFAVKGGWLTAALDVRVLKRHLRRIAGQSSGLLGNERIAESWERLTAGGHPLTGISYCALPELYPAAVPYLYPLRAQLLEEFGWELPFDLSALPAGEVVTRHLLPTVAVSHRLENGWLFEREGTLGGELTSLGAGLGGAAMAVWVSFLADLGRTGENFVAFLAKGKQDAARISVDVLTSAVTHYFMNNDRLPESLEVLARPDPNFFNEVYIEDPSMLIDPWGTPFVYRPTDGRNFEILSLGADGLPGGQGKDQDISSRAGR